MVKSLALAAALVPSAMAINTDGGLYSSFVSLSIELIGFPDWAGSRSNANEYSNNLINGLVSAQGSPMVVRVGGNSADRAIYDETLTAPTAASCPNADPGAYQCIGPKFFDSYGAFPQGTLYSHNFNVATWNSSGFRTLEATVPLACNALRGHLALFEIGNEPDLYNGKRRDSDYNVHDYLADWTNTTGRFESYLQAACPDMVKTLQYMFPSVSSPGSRLRVPDMYKAAAAGDSLKHVTQVSVHNYMAGATQPGVTLQATLMNHTAVARSIAGHVAYARSISATDADYVIGEHNSLYGGGAVGLSDIFGAALWGMDFSLQAASTGIIKRVHFHQSIGSPYAAWAPISPQQQTKPPYYGKLAAGTFLANSSSALQVKTLDLGGRADLDSGYAAYVEGRLERIAILNLREYDSGSGKSRGKKEYAVKVEPSSHWTVKRLSASGARDKTGVTFNGFAYEAETMGKPERVGSRPSDEQLKASKCGKLVVKVADSEAVVIVQD
ncbi:glycoside hydrolase family 79 [Akanthomyces lecanii RCEF 1005]|uniref:Glycoside hydrolase family 79 n=1 Tax=Akanthomyces lecanii RCEF 1005 TaxID=1081108 RepID=A0A168HFS5_CORDF|nr:glycoside hydrolase family 79 [Akanthomyces lecanii RCEF 1005]